MTFIDNGEKGLERTKLMEPWKMLKYLKLENENLKCFKIGDLNISEI